ncbi:MAG: hypothetical protein GF330_00615 [Candidatus Eisenbacteria bacterium]|nr:hypothetical protein [Candidatus Eisenbacteria bacterium]
MSSHSPRAAAFPVALLCLLASLPLLAPPAGALPDAADRCPFTGRFPVEIALDGPWHLSRLADWKLDVDHVTGSRVVAFVDDEGFADLQAAGFEVRAIPNQARRMFLELRRDGREAYHTYETLTAELQQIAADHPDITQLISIGPSVQGRELWFLKISDNVTVDEPEPEFKYSSTMHGDEAVGTELCVYLIRRLVEDYGLDPEITALVDDLEIWIMPLHNPDGFENGTRYNAQGYDLNRTFPDPVDDPVDDPSGRPTEVQHMMYFVYDHSFLLSANLHTGALVVNYPWDSMYGQYTPDHTMIHNLSAGYAIRNPPMYNNPQFPGGITIGWDWYVIHGGLQDWSYYWRNEIDLTIELCNTKWPPESWLPGLWDDNEEAMLWLMNQARIGVEGFVTDAGDGYPIQATYDVLEIGKPMWGEPTQGYYHRLLEPGTYTFEFSAFGYEAHTEHNVQVADDETTRLDVALTPTARHVVSGTVTEQGSGLPLAAEVSAYRHDDGELFRTVTTEPESGAYEIEVPSWEYDFVARAEAHVPVTETRLIEGDTTLDFSLLPARGEIVLVKDGNPEPNMVADLTALGYLVTEENAGATEPADWPDYDLLVWSAGSQRNPISSSSERAAVEAYVAAGGKLLIEGGEVGYDATVNPGYPSFASGVLHISDFDADDAGRLELRPDQTDHPLVTTPNALPTALPITYDYFADEDALVPLGDATLIYGTQDYPTDAGLLVYEVTGRNEGQIVFYAFDYNALTNGGDAAALLENTVAYLVGENQSVPETSSAAPPHLSRIYPSVTRDGAVLQLRLSDAAPVQVDLFDATGRRVRRIASGPLSAGAHLLHWDGRDETGHAAPAGVYFLRASIPQAAAARRIVVVE